MASRQFPKIYLKFEGRREVDGRKCEYWIQDATEDMFEEIEEHLVNHFVCDEPTTKYMKCLEDPVSLAEFRAMWHNMLEEQHSLVCLTEDHQNNIKLAGFNVLTESKADDKKEYQLNGACSKRLLKIFKWVEAQRDMHAEFQLPRIMKAMGLYVLPNYRGQALGARILEAREYLCRNVGFSATLTAFTSFISQKLAARVGFKDFYTIDYEELGRIDSEMTIPDIHNHTKTLKYMYKLYN